MVGMPRERRNRQEVIMMDEKVLLLKEKIDQADAVIIGAGAGLSTAAGFVYAGERFDRYFSDFSRKYGFRDMYIPAGFILMIRRKNSGRTGAGISGSTAIWMRRNPPTAICFSW